MSTTKVAKLQITEDDIEEFYDAFLYFSFRDKGREIMNVRDFPRLLRLLGQNATEAERIHMVNEAIEPIVKLPKKTGSETEIEFNESEKVYLDFQTLLKILKKNFQTVQTLEDILLTFSVFDKNCNGLLAVPEIQFIMHSLGEIFPEDEIVLMLKEADKDNDCRINIHDFINIMGLGDL